MNRAYSVLDWKAVDEDKRIIEGIATTPEPDRMGDIVETDGIEFKLPMPLLYQHNARMPIGQVISAKVGKDGIRIKAQVAAPGVAGFIDEAWALVKSGLVRGLSIGFRSLEDAFMKDKGGFRIIRSEWLELSVVTLAANASASILSVKSASTAARAAFGESRAVFLRTDASSTPGATGSLRTANMKTITEQISAFESSRAASAARMDAIMAKAAEEARTLNDEETTEYDDLQMDVKKVDEHLVRLKAHEKAAIANAARITPENTTPDASANGNGSARHSNGISVTSMRPKGIGVARMAIAMIRGNNNPLVAAQMAKQYWPDQPEVELALKAAVEAGDTTTSGWASQLVPSAVQMESEFLELLRDATVIGRIPGLRRVPFNISIPIETASGTANWVGEGAPKPVTKLTLDSVTLRWAKVAAIVAITKELARFSRPDAELVVRNSMVQTVTRFLDAYFVGTAAEITNVAPAGILNGVSATTGTGTTASAFRVDINNLLNNFTANKVPLENIVFLMSATQAVAFSLMVTDLGVPLFPTINRGGGSLVGFPVVVSEAVGTKIIALNPDNILLAEDPGVQVDVSDQASVEMSDTPIAGDTSPFTSAVLKSFWQNNLIGVRVEQFMTWKKARTSAVEYINNSNYLPS